MELTEYKDAVMNAMYRGTKRNIESENDSKKRARRASDEELFTRLLYYGVGRLYLSIDEVWLTPFGLLLDLWECHKQFIGATVPQKERFIDDIIPDGI